MTTSSRVRCALYAVIAASALVATWSQNIAYHDSPATFLPDFVADLMATAAGRSFTADLLLLSLAVVILMLVEARRQGVRFVWAYIVAGIVIAISVSFPVFLIAREVAMTRRAATS